VNGFNCIQFRPLYLADLGNISTEDIKRFVTQLEHVTQCINAALSCAPQFEEVIQTCPGLQCVHVRNFVGIGAVRYLPSFLRGVNLALEVNQEVDAVNSTLAAHLNDVDGLFSEGKTTEGKTCVCLGVETKPITSDSPVYYANLLQEMIEKLGLKAKIEEKFDSILRDGIRAAQQHLELESELAEQNQGIIRSIPLVGNMVNWWSPVEKKVQGKSFDIGSTALRNVVFSPRPEGSTPPPSPSQKPQGTPPSPYQPPSQASSRPVQSSTPPATPPKSLVDNIPMPEPLPEPITKD